MSLHRNARRLSGLAAALVLAAAAPRVADACSVCLAGDPNFSTHGASTLESGRLAVYLELRGWEKRSGSLAHGGHGGHGGHEHGEHAAADDHAHAAHVAPRHAGHPHDGPAPEEEMRSRRLDLYLAWTPIDRLTLTLNLPWAFNGMEMSGDGERHMSLSGFGDLSLAASGVVWRNRDVLPSTWLEARVWGKAPTGRDEKRVDGERDPHLQAGTGSWDFGLGGAVVHRTRRASFYASAFYRWNGDGALDYRYGDVALATLAVESPLDHLLGRPSLRALVPGLALDLRWAERDRQAGEPYADSGGVIPYLSPSLRIILPGFGPERRAWLRTGVQAPLTNRWLYGDQDEGLVWSVGLGIGL